MSLDRNSLAKFAASDTEVEHAAIGGPIDPPMSPKTKRLINAPVRWGLGIMAVFFLGFGVWASTAPISGAVTASGVIKVETNKKTLKSRDGGVIREINVTEGQRVTPQTTLIKFDDSNLQAQSKILQNQYYTFLMQSARLQAEIIGSNLIIPEELKSRSLDPEVSAVIGVETTVFNARKQAYEGQLSILRERINQLKSSKAGLDIQVNAIGEQLGYMREELRGYRAVFEQGYASRAIVNRLQRQVSELQARQGQLVAEISRNRQQIGEAQLQGANLQQQRASEAAGARTEAETRLVDIANRLEATREAIELTSIRSPVDGYVIGLSQFTIGGVAAPGEVLLQIIPSDTPLIIEARIHPNDIDQVSVGLETKVTLSAYSASKVPSLEAEVLSITPDAIVVADSDPFYIALVRILPSELKKLEGVRQPIPGMQATVMIKTGKRTFLSYLYQPINDNINRALREE
jgi:HlyD family type I secretion membrane fusion protein